MRRQPLARSSSRPLPRPLVFLLALALALGGLPLPGVAGGGVARAAACTVTTVADAGAGSLREKLTDFNCPAIHFALPGGGPWTITLSSNLPTVARAVSVTGPGAARLTIARTVSGSGTAFTVDAAGNLTLSGVTVTGSYNAILLNTSGATATVTNSTVSGNTYGLYLSFGKATVINSTVSGNDTGLYFSSGGKATVINTVLAKGSDANCSNDGGGTFTNGGHNLADDATCTGIAATPALGLDPAGLKNNGGPTETIALLPSSPAVGAGDAAVCAATGVGEVNGVDQRGIARPQGNGCDVGAYELRAFSLTVGNSGTGTGTVDPASGTYLEGETVSLRATPTEGSTFTGWSVDNVAVGDTNPLPLVMNGPHTVYASFTVPTVILTVSTAGAGSGTATPLGTTTHPQDGELTLTASPAPGSTFVGWTLDGTLVSWATSVTLTMNTAHTVVATFQPLPTFGDVPAGANYADPVAQLAARGIINGCDSSVAPPLFCPSEPTLRHQLAALIARAMPGWVNETGLPTFTDNTEDTELMTRVATLQRHNVVRGYQDEVCTAQGKTPPCYGPLDTVKYGQTILFIARAMVEKGYWQLQPDDRSIFPDQNGAAGANPDTDQQTRDHRMVVTYVYYVGNPPDVADVHAPFQRDGVAAGGWADDSSRAWFTRAFWPALQSYFGQDNLP